MSRTAIHFALGNRRWLKFALAYASLLAITGLAQAQTERVLHAFSGGADGADPSADLIRDTAGNLYGTTYLGSASGNGTVYRVSPNRVYTVLYSFTGGAD